MILEIDIGNTWTKWRLVAGVGAAADVVARGRTFSVDFPQQDVLSLRAVRRVRLASVASRELTARVEQSLSSVLGVDVAVAETAQHQAGLTNAYLDPSRMGVDRWLAMLAAFNHQSTRTAKRGCLVVSCGTAVTFDSIRDDGVHEGGYIIPGLYMMRAALLSGTGRIQFTPGDFDVVRALGHSTAQAVEHGAVHAILSAIEQGCDERTRRLGACDVFVTGGDAPVLSQQLRLASASVSIRCVDDLVLEGLQYALP